RVHALYNVYIYYNHIYVIISNHELVSMQELIISKEIFFSLVIYCLLVGDDAQENELQRSMTNYIYMITRDIFTRTKLSKICLLRKVNMEEILKKQKKYAPNVLIPHPSAQSICETYFKKSPAHIGFVRVDTLSLLLPMVNISAYSDVLVVDMVGGLVVGAVAEHLGGTGYVCSTCLGSAPSTIDIIRMYNLSSDMVS
ncbi:hypothetical protein ACJX0J_035593, partial [Zea mays]